VLLEIIVQSVADARAATAGGADRLEVVRDIDCGGLTPPLELVRAVASETSLPLRVMVRENDGFSVSGARELLALQRAFAAVAAVPVDGAVLGFANGGTLDLNTTRAVLSAAPTLRATFHRAFDTAPDPAAAIGALEELPQVDRILTTGGTGDWAARGAALARLARMVGNGLIVLVGGGVDAAAIQALASLESICEVHVGRAARQPPIPSAPVSVECVRRLREISSRQWS
jgi:copper homeostasis protein